MAEEKQDWWQKIAYQRMGQTIGWVFYALLLLLALSLIARGSILGVFLGIPFFFGGLALLWWGIALVKGKSLVGIASLIIGSLLFIIGAVFMIRGSFVGTLLAVPLILLGLFLLVYYYLAPTNRWFTFVQEGTAKVVKRGDKFHKALIQWEGRTLDKTTWDVITGKEYHLFGGLRSFGPYPLDYIYRHWFEWTGLEPDGVTPKEHERELLDYIMLKQDVYFGRAKEAEDKERLPLDISFVLTIKVTNPYKALFEVQNWLETVMARTIAAIRDRITEEPFEKLIAKASAIGGDIYDRLNEEDQVFDLFRKRYGIDVLALEILEIEPPREQREAVLKEFVAKQERKRITIEAKAEKERLKTVAKGEVQRINLEYGAVQAFGEFGRIIRALEALEKSPEQGAKWVVAVPGLGDLISTAFGGKPVSQISPEEFKGLKELLEKEEKSST